MKETGNISKSQYSGTKKNSICNICKESLNHLDRVKQDKHAEQCIKNQIENAKQQKLF